MPLLPMARWGNDWATGFLLYELGSPKCSNAAAEATVLSSGTERDVSEQTIRGWRFPSSAGTT